MGRRGNYRPTPPPDAEGDIAVPVRSHILTAHWRLEGDYLTVIPSPAPNTGGRLDPNGGSPEEQAKAMLLAHWVKLGGRV